MLPETQHAVIELTKVVDYLFNPAHPDNGGKAAFFLGWGFVAADWEAFDKAVREMISAAPVADRVESDWGTKYVVEWTLTAPNGITPMVRTVWIVDQGATWPRLVTAYPRK